MINLPRYRIKYLFIIFIGALFLSACSPAERQIKPIKIGVITDLSGFAALWGENIKYGALLAAEEINAQGGVNGRPLEIIIEDGKSNNKDHVTAAHKLIYVDKALVIVEQWTSEALSMLPIAEAANVIIVCAVCSAPGFTESSPVAFRTWASDGFLIEALVDHAKQAGYLHPAVMMTIGDWEQSLKDEYAKKWDVELPVESVERGSTDYRTSILKLREMNPDAIFLATNFGDALWFINQMKELDLNWPLYAPAGALSPEIMEIGEGLVLADWSSSNKQFKNAFLQKYGQDAGIAADTSYDAVKISVIAMKSDGITPEQIKEGLLGIKEYDGASGSITIMPNRDRESREVVLKKVIGGQPTKI